MERTPILAMLRRYADGNPARFHMPGHMGRGSDLPLSLDATELPGTDSLYGGGQAVTDARSLAARACGAHGTFLLTGGASQGIRAMMTYPDEPVAVSRASHLSVFCAGWLSGRGPAAVEPEWDRAEQMFRCEFPMILGAAGPGAWALVTTPSYYGCVCDLEPLQDRLLIVDAAHGAHFRFGLGLPASPAGRARLWVESAHKTLPAPTQTAWLHYSREADPERLERLLRAMDTSSPSWLLLAGLDRARAEAEEKRDAWAGLAARCVRMEREIAAIPGLRACGREWARALGYADKDPTRLVVDVRGTGMTGFEAAASLRREGVQPEMADFCRVVFIATPWNVESDFDRLMRSLRQLTDAASGRPCGPDPVFPSPGDRICAASEAFRKQGRLVPLRLAAGGVAVSAAGSYPPGVPCWLPGERITAEAVEWMLRVRKTGGSLFGVNGDMAEVIG